MKVGQPGSNSVQNGEVATPKHGGRTSASQETKKAEKAEKSDRSASVETAKGSVNDGAKAEISAKSREFAQAKSIASQTPDIREDRVEDLKKRLSEGTYKIDTDSIADRMVDDHLRRPGAI